MVAVLGWKNPETMLPVFALGAVPSRWSTGYVGLDDGGTMGRRVRRADREDGRVQDRSLTGGT